MSDDDLATVPPPCSIPDSDAMPNGSQPLPPLPSWTRKFATWTDADDRKLVQVLKGQQRVSPSTLNGFKQAAWTAAAAALAGSELTNGSKPKDAAACRSRYNSLKKKYLQLEHLSELSGAGWNKALRRIELPECVWNALATNPSKNGKELLQWKNRSFPLFEELADLIDGRMTNADLAISSAMELPEPPKALPTDSQETMATDTSVAISGWTPSPSPPPLARKRPRRNPPSPSVELVGQLEDLAHRIVEGLSNPAPLPPTPTFRAQAITILQEQADMTDPEFYRAVQILRSAECAEVYVSLRPERRNAWLRMEMEML